jgi:hypothetical protein
MFQSDYTPLSGKTKQARWNRGEATALLAAFEALYQQPVSQRQFAQHHGIPRTTLQYWLARKASLDVAPAVAGFFESPDGLAFVHRLVVAAHLVFTQMGPCGIRLVCLFLKLSGLERFVGASYGPQQKLATAMEQAIVAFGQQEASRLAVGLRPKKITVCQDETFHPQTCLVAIEPVSNFILLEQYASNRMAQTWTTALEKALEGLPIEVVQSTSDEGRGILHHVQQDLGAHHSPDLFHVQREAAKATSVVLAGKVRQAEKAVEAAAQQVSRHRAEKEASLHGRRGPGRPAALDHRIEKAQHREAKASETLQTARAHQERARAAIRGISHTYHPYDLETGATRSAEDVAASLEKHFSEIEALASQAPLPQRCCQRIKKAKRVVVEMVATLAFFFLTIRAKVEALGLSPEMERAVYEQLIPAVYLSLVSKKAPGAEQRATLQKRSQELLAPLWARDGPWGGLAQEELELITQVAKDCAQGFQRSSSCVEGRNGQLALRHHHLHRISHRKLAALTTIHNYGVKRLDGTTAAERFFGSPPRDLFAWLLEQVDLPCRPANKRPHPQPKEYGLQTAA